MSRLHEALRRTTDDVLADRADDRETLFTPAWSVATAEPEPASGTDGGDALLVGEHYTAIKGFNEAWRERLAIGDEANALLVEQFRRLAGMLHHAQTTDGLHLIMVTSAAPGDGKTLTAVNLGLVLSESYRRRVLLIDADLRRPSIGNVMDVTGRSGLSEALKASSDQKLALVQLTPNLTLLPAGKPDPDPLGGLTSRRMQAILQEAVTKFDWVILDAPPLGPITDASVLSKMVDGTLFVVRAGQTQLANVQHGIEAIGRERILGIVLNGLTRMPTEPYGRYYGEEEKH